MLSLIVAAALVAQEPAPAYQAVFLRAAPGHLLELIDLLNSRMPVYQAAGEARPVLMRHSQGDQWDLLLLAPIGSLERHFGAERQARWSDAVRRLGFDDVAFEQRRDEWVAWQEELYVAGPPVADLEAAAARSGYFHLEIFQALAGKRDSLLRERRMENDFLVRTGKAPNFIFTKLTGSAWDSFTIGFYRDLQHYAEPSRLAAEEENQAAVAAGFESRNHIGAYLRRFIAGHHDTLGGVVR
ncbi:MAG: hypothetical protein R2882_00820 [Gemmatimonadales bacterium]